MDDVPFSLQQLQIFAAVARSGSMTEAARQLHLSQPAVSQAIAELERRLDVVVFDRVRRKLHLTSEGEVLLHRAVELLELAHETALQVTDVGEGVGGTLSLGASTSVGNYLLPDSICTFQQAHPRMRVRLLVDISEQIVERLLDREVPLAFIEGPCHRPGVRVDRFRRDELVVVFPPNHPFAGQGAVAWEDLMRERLILRAEGGTRDVIERVLDRHGLRVEPDLEFGHTEAIKSAVGLGHGVSILGRITVQRELEAGLLGAARVDGLQFDRWLSVLALEGRRRGPLAEAFLTHIDALFTR